MDKNAFEKIKGGQPSNPKEGEWVQNMGLRYKAYSSMVAVPIISSWDRMIFNPTEKQVPCPWCGIDIDLDVMKYPLGKPVVESCTWCGRRVRIMKKLRRNPKAKRGLEFILTKCKKESCGRRKE
ncbi:hypothetical protein ES703_120669 [subsurface metagenome]